jgi:hypothetical protein
MVGHAIWVAVVVLLIVWIGSPDHHAPSEPAKAAATETPQAATSAQPPKPELASATAAQQEAEALAQFPTLDADARKALETVRDQLLDPDSAQFRNVWAMRYPVQGQADAAIFCGEVNGRNRMGGYSGFQPFMALGHTAYTAETSGVFEGMYRDYCLTAVPIVEIDADRL